MRKFKIVLFIIPLILIGCKNTHTYVQHEKQNHETPDFNTDIIIRPPILSVLIVYNGCIIEEIITAHIMYEVYTVSRIEYFDPSCYNILPTIVQ